MKLNRVQSPKSRVQRAAYAPSTLLDSGYEALGFKPDQRGIALVITLIMLSVITFMAVTFLVLSQRDQKSVSTATDAKIARGASDTAFARVCTELLSKMLLQTNFQDFNLMVSTNYVNYGGFIDGLSFNPRNVNYDHETNQIAFSGGAVEWERNIANLLYNPRAPVFVVTNAGTGSNEFRFYLDLNRNGRFETNGMWPEINSLGGFFNGTNGVLEPVGFVGPLRSNNFVGDPEWIGVLERPEELHAADNKFISRYAYLVVPAGKALDLNYNHNRAKRPVSASGEGFLRNQGVGTYEINLAGFLADLNTNAWWANNNYVYNTNTLPGAFSTGSAFTNANDLLSYRYGPSGYVGLSSASALLANATAFASDGIDHYSDGPLMLGTDPDPAAPADVPTIPWSGSDNINHVFTPQDLFDTSKAGPSFPPTFASLGTSNDSYNAYTFSRLVSQLGTDSDTDRTKINVNYKNTDINGNVIPGMETNMIAWTPLEFFTNAAAAMFKQLNLRDLNGNLITVTNIPIYQDPIANNGTNINYYTPAVQRILQVAANMYDATTNRALIAGQTSAFFPSVFRPYFRSQGGVVSIAGYVEENDTLGLSMPMLETTNFVKTTQLNLGVNLVGVPWVIGAKKGFPNFNEYSMENGLTVTRKLQFTNYNNVTWTGITNQMFLFAITNSFGVEAWNSYTNAFPRPLRLVVSNQLSVIISNELGTAFVNATDLPFGTNLTINSWEGWDPLSTKGSCFKVPFQNAFVLTNALYLANPPQIIPINPPVWSATGTPRLYMALSIRLQFYMIDTTANRVVDFVNLRDDRPAVDILNYAKSGENPNAFPGDTSPGGEWTTNTFPINNGIAEGIRNQITVGLGKLGVNDWKDLPPGSKAGDIACFKYHLMGQLTGGVQCTPTNNFQDPYTPSRAIYQSISWQANDPLVHYMPTDLTNTLALAPYNRVDVDSSKNLGLPNLGNENFAFQPWGGYPLNPDPNTKYNFLLKDPGVGKSDDWDFVTNKLPNIGWLGRVHRGTAWQTVYMKGGVVPLNDWKMWTGDSTTNGTTVDATLTVPIQDYPLFDLFTTAVHDNATRGQLNINQTNLAAWSAVLSGVTVLTNSATGLLGSAVIDPAGIYDPTNATPVAQIWQGINDTRANNNPTNRIIFPNHTFQHLGDVLATPQLSSASPFLNTNVMNQTGAGGINDEVMERIPQQIMSLLSLSQTPRFVIYSFGQTLHPADHSLVTGGTFNGLCTNYQITAEIATRAVVRVEGSPDPFYVNGKLDTLGRSYPPHIVVEQFNVLPPD